MALTGAFGTGASKAKAKLKKPKDLPKTVNKGSVSPMIAPNLYVTPRAPNIVPRTTTGTGTYATVGPAPTETRYVPAATGGVGSAPGMIDAGGGVPGVSATSGTGASAGVPGGYTPTAITSGYLNDNPDVIAADVLASMGITNPDVIGMLTDVTGDYGLAMQLLTGGGVSGFAPSGGEVVDFMQGFAQNMMTPGGALPDIDNLMASIMNADPNSALGQFLATQGPEGVNNLIRVAARMGTSNPYFTAGLEKQLDQMDLGYRQGIAHGTITDPDSYYQSVRTGPLGGYF